MAAIDSDPVPNAPQPMASVDDTVVVASSKIPTADASDLYTKENQSLNSVDIQLESDSGAASLPEVTKLAPEELASVVANVLSEVKELANVTGPTIVEDETDGSKPEAAAIHLKDAVAENNVSDATTIVVANEAEDTPEIEAVIDTKAEGIRASTSEEAPTISHDKATEISASAEEAVLTAAAPALIEDEPAAGLADPVVTTTTEVEAPVAEQELTQSVSGELNEATQPNSDEISELPNLAPAEENIQVDDEKARPVVEEAEHADNEDAKKEVEEPKPTEVETASEIEDKAAKLDANVDDESTAEVKAKEVEESKVEVIEPEVSIQVEETTPAPAASSLVADETPIDVEVVAPTPALVDSRQLEESDTEDTAASQEVSSTPAIAEEQDLASEGTATPNLESEASIIVEDPIVPQEVAQVASVNVNAPAADAPPAVEEVVALGSVDVPIQVAEEHSFAEEISAEAPITPEDEESALEAEPKVDGVDPSETEPEPIVEAIAIHEPETTEEIPVADDGLPAADDKLIVEDAHATTSREEPTAEEPTDISTAAEVETEIPLVEEPFSAKEPAEPVVAQDEPTSVVAPQTQSEPTEEAPIEEAVGVQEEEAAVPQEQAAVNEGAVEEDSQAVEEQLLVESAGEAGSPEDNAAEDEAVAAEQPTAVEPTDVDIPLSSEENATATKDAGETEPLDEEPAKEEIMAVDQVDTTGAVIGEMPSVEDAAAAEVPPTEVVGNEVVEQTPAEDPLDQGPAAEEPTTEAPVEPVSAEPGVEEPSEDVTGLPAVEEAPLIEESVVEAPLAEPAVAKDEEIAKEVTEEMEEPVIETTPVPESIIEIPAASQPEVIEEPAEEDKVASELTVEISAIVEESPAADEVEGPVVKEEVAEVPAIAKGAAKTVADGAVEEQPTAEVVEAEALVAEEPATEGVPSTEPIREEVVPNVLTADSAVGPAKADVPAVREAADAEEEPIVPLDVQVEEAPVAEAVAEQIMDATPAEQHSAVAETHIDIPAADEPEADAKTTDESFVGSETSEVDTTTETIIVPEHILEKKDISASFIEEDTVADVTPAAETEAAGEIPALPVPALDIPEDTSRIERPKSPWTPSFQVTTIGHGVSLPADNDIPIEYLDGTEETKDTPAPQPLIVIEDQSTESGAGEVQPSPEEAGTPESSSSWTPSYSVHLQGSPNPPQASLEPDVSIADIVDQDAQEEITATPAVEDVTAPENVAPPVVEEAEHVLDAKSAEVEPIAVEEPSAAPNAPEVIEVPTPSLEHQTVEAAIVIPIVEPETQAEQQSEKQIQEEPVQPEPQPVESQPFEESLEDLSSLTPPSEQNRSASSSWVPSYSVSRQGSPLPQPAPLPSIATDVSEFNLASDATFIVEDRGVQDASLVLPTVVVDDRQPEEAKELQAAEDQPSTPWTPSYSVTRQGTDILEDTQLESLVLHDQPTEAKAPGPQPRRSLSEEMEESAAFSATALIGAGVAGGVLAASAILGRPKDAPVANGDTGSGPRQEKAFPSVEIPDENAKLNAAPLPPLDENSALDTTSALSPESSPVSSRKRLESTTSSRLFPGGWFSNTSKIPDERTSLEVAQGVFTGTKQGPTVEDALVSPVMEPITPDREYSSEKKRWCVIM